MVVGMYQTVGQKVTRNPRTVEEFETMMKETLKEARGYVSPFVKKSAEDKKVITYDPKKNPFAPLYRPDREIIVKKDKYHQIDPVVYITPKKEEPKVLLVAAGAGGVPPQGGGGDKSPNIKDLSKIAKYAEVKNSITKENANIYNRNSKG